MAEIKTIKAWISRGSGYEANDVKLHTQKPEFNEYPEHQCASWSCDDERELILCGLDYAAANQYGVDHNQCKDVEIVIREVKHGHGIATTGFGAASLS